VAEITQSTVGMCLEAFKIIEECWKIRMICPGACVSRSYTFIQVAGSAVRLLTGYLL
jgi:hypothetical protein